MSTSSTSFSPILSDFVPKSLSFVKLEGLGNDFVLFKDQLEIFSSLTAEARKSLIQAVCNRRTGVGADQVIFLEYKKRTAENEADISFFNSDGEEAGACGNGTRCAALQVAQLSKLTCIVLNAKGRTLNATVALHNDDFTMGLVSVNMGKALFSWENIPLSQSLTTQEIKLEVQGQTITGSACSVGNPHFTIFCDKETGLEDKAFSLGPILEKHDLFKEGCNVTFCHVSNPSSIIAHVWERGSGITLACGTGACATFANARRLGLINETCDIQMPGGILSLSEKVDGTILMTGNANESFKGSFDVADLLLRHGV